eukprot:Protomagalhaensia_wolfi_Nauph_80__6136@NODE_88_length_3841_cov_12_884534_g67_i0_p2_GENE_NODE_88_length_3841_cov_12_884534_g67_i0NODE_88_length_3841_cov_12_884534_g67_i0_p2_ORF_typecomplete_len205_score36_97Tim17/PF02466_19/0_00058Glyzipper_Omp/PF13488_6/1_5e02Glyzipper_Omp/PF13488_6/0_41Glyzipper_Omp/PF13488_6/2_6e03Glyzipper_YMGG/PF13441_6/1_5e02Glyzipper_YMGG/PF13441_6/1_8Rick_17kDa_Anti/PF05433_15/2_8e02Rick_17kDa_Anti/PF05433_15/0_73Rick_17kDa_Anti/PF05433_15/5_1e03_NODE_88_length_3841_cov_1
MGKRKEFQEWLTRRRPSQRVPILSATVSSVGSRQFSEIVCYDAGKSYLHALILGGVLGFIRGNDKEAAPRVSLASRLDAAIDYSTNLSPLSAGCSLVYAGYRWGLHQFVPHDLLQSKTARAAVAGTLAGATIGLSMPSQKLRSALKFSLVGTGWGAAEHIWAVNRGPLARQWSHWFRIRAAMRLQRWRGMWNNVDGFLDDDDDF